MKTGIYKLVFKNTDKVYVGQSTNIDARFRQHLSALRTGTKANCKLHEAYKLHGYPSLVVLEELPNNKDILLDRERFFVNYYNSIENGYNMAIPNFNPILKGEDNGNAAYTNKQYIEIAKILIKYNNLPLSEISELTGISYHILKHMSALESHAWIKNEYPDLWNKLFEIKNGGRRGVCFNGRYTPILVSPNGVEYKITHITNFAKEHGLSQPKISEVINCKRLHHKGWHLKGTDTSQFLFSIKNTTTGMVIPVYNGNGSVIANSLGFKSHNICDLKNGRIKNMGDWVLIKDQKNLFEYD